MMHESLKTKFGNVAIRATEASHIYVGTGSFVNMSVSPVIVNGVEYSISGHFYLHNKGTHLAWDLGAEHENSFERRRSLYVSRYNVMRPSQSGATEAARAALETELVRAVQIWASENSETLCRAEIEHLEDMLANGLAEQEKARTKLADIGQLVENIKHRITFSTTLLQHLTDEAKAATL